MFRKVGVGVAVDDLGRRVASEDRFSVEVDLGSDGLFLVGLQAEQDSIMLMSGEVSQIGRDRATSSVPAREAERILEIARDGLSVLTSREVVVAR